MGFWASLFGGSNPTLSSAIGSTGQIAGTATSLGTNNLNSASNWLNAITSGDASKTMQALSPITSAAKKSQQTQAKTNSIFGTRSGGTTGANIASSDKLHSDITNLIGSLTGSAVSEQANLGSSLLQTGLGAYTTQADLSQQRMQNWSDSIFGLSTTKAAGYGLGALIGAL